MIPKFRAWDKQDKIISEVLSIDFLINVAELYYRKEDEQYVKPFSDIILEQSTGLKDKNGKEIFEGDIFEYPHLGITKAVVVYKHGNWYLNNLELENEHDLLWTECELGEVIGNIYENPELLEVDE